jgi:hypothetical protein
LSVTVRAAVISYVRLAVEPTPSGMIEPAQFVPVLQVPAASTPHVPFAANADAARSGARPARRRARIVFSDVFMK